MAAPLAPGLLLVVGAPAGIVEKILAKGKFIYLCTNADLVAVVAQQEFAPRLAAIQADLPKLRHVVVAADDSGASTEGLDFADYETALAAAMGSSGAAVVLAGGIVRFEAPNVDGYYPVTHEVCAAAKVVPAVPGVNARQTTAAAYAAELTAALKVSLHNG